MQRDGLSHIFSFFWSGFLMEYYFWLVFSFAHIHPLVWAVEVCYPFVSSPDFMLVFSVLFVD